MPGQAKRKFWQTEEFKELQKIWEEKLVISGFGDLEWKGKKLKQRATGCFKNYRAPTPITIENNSRYYDLLGHWYHEEDFSDPVEKYVMERTAQGARIMQIGEELKSFGQRNSIETIRKIIRFYEAKWRIIKKKTPRLR